MTDQERPSDPGTPAEGSTPPEGPTTPEGTTPPEQPAVPASDQPTVGWTAPTPPSSAPVPSGWGGSDVGTTPGTTPPPPDQPVAPAGTPWGTTPPPPPVPPTGPLLSASPAPQAGWTQPAQTAFGQREVAPGLVFSGTAARFVAYVIDGFLLAIVGSVVRALFGAGTGYNPADPYAVQTAYTGGSILVTIVTVVISGAYFIAFWSGGRRATLGQMLLKIQVGNAFDGKPLTTTQAVKRWIGLGEFLQAFAISLGAAAAIGTLGLLWSLVLFITTATSPTKQGLHDKFANSAVVRPAGAGNGIVWACLIVVVILPIIAIVAIVGLIFLGGQVSSILSAVGDSV